LIKVFVNDVKIKYLMNVKILKTNNKKDVSNLKKNYIRKIFAKNMISKTKNILLFK
jgi:hypothetical protein